MLLGLQLQVSFPAFPHQTRKSLVTRDTRVLLHLRLQHAWYLVILINSEAGYRGKDNTPFINMVVISSTIPVVYSSAKNSQDD